ncbi:MAG TPA: hypothetical protein VJ761_20295, partial [Ktedonobacteraceae bacterium]|nr:hypothetical protein [Ktedonobacteraceae bacterium]
TGMLTKFINLLVFSSNQRLPAHLLLVKDCCGLAGANFLLALSLGITESKAKIFLIMNFHEHHRESLP